MTLAQVVDGVTDLDSALFNPIIDAVNNSSSGIANVLDYGAVGDGVADDTAAIQAAIASGKAVYAPGSHEYGISDLIEFTVPLIGTGMDRTVFKAIHTDAGIHFPAPTLFRCGDWRFDGSDIATQGVTAQSSNGSAWRNIQVDGVAGTGFRIQNVQNASFDNIQVTGCESGLWVDDGSGSCVFNAAKLNQSDLWQLKIGSSGEVESDYTEPTRIIFNSLVAEWIGVNAPANVEATVVIEGLSGGVFLNCQFVGPPGRIAPAFDISVHGDAVRSEVAFISSSITGNPAEMTAFALTGQSRLDLIGHNEIVGALKGFTLDGAAAFISGPQPKLANVTTPYTYTNGAAAHVNRATDARFLRRFTAETTATLTDMVLVDGEAGARQIRYADGKQEWGDGSGFSLDTNFYRSAANLLKTDDSLELPGTYLLPLRLGAYCLWVNPGDGKLYIKPSVPSNATDGTVVGTQS